MATNPYQSLANSYSLYPLQASEKKRVTISKITEREFDNNENLVREVTTEETITEDI